MEFEWDESKRLSNIRKHEFDSIDVNQIFNNAHVEGAAKLGKDGEQRFSATGLIYGIDATVIDTMRGDVTRIISLRRAWENERRGYQALYGG